MVCTKNCHNVWLEILNEMKILIDGIGIALIPGLAESHLGRHRRDEKVLRNQRPKSPRLQVFNQGLTLKLYEYVYAVNFRIDKFDSTKSINRYLPPKGTAGLARSRVSGCRRCPSPPAMTMARILGAISASFLLSRTDLPMRELHVLYE